MITNKHPRIDSGGVAAPVCGNAASEALRAEGTQASVQVGAHRCHIVCVDSIVPRHVEGRHGTRARLAYVDGEIVHFELDHHRYALVLEHVIEPEELRPAPPIDLRDLLTNREMQIVQLICLGYLTKQVADRLHLSEFTVRSYVKSVYCKLGVRSRAAMVFRYTQAFSVPADSA
jgi:DNA-binding CsgD family transcriptional regulator